MIINEPNTYTRASHEAYPQKVARNEEKEEIMNPMHIHAQAIRLTPLRQPGRENMIYFQRKVGYIKVLNYY